MNRRCRNCAPEGPGFQVEKGNAIEDQLFDAPKKTLRSIIAVVKKLTSSNPLLTALEHLEQNDCIENRPLCSVGKRKVVSKESI